MDWTREQGYWLGTYTTMDAEGIVRKAPGGGWEVESYLYGALIDVRIFRLLADAKWHASETVSSASCGWVA